MTQPVRDEVTKLITLSITNAADDFSLQPSRFRGDRNKAVEHLAVDLSLALVSFCHPQFLPPPSPACGPRRYVAMMWWPGHPARVPSAPIFDSDISAIATRCYLMNS